MVRDPYSKLQWQYSIAVSLLSIKIASHFNHRHSGQPAYCFLSKFQLLSPVTEGPPQFCLPQTLFHHLVFSQCTMSIICFKFMSSSPLAISQIYPELVCPVDLAHAAWLHLDDPVSTFELWQYPIHYLSSDYSS